jgi:hypothetical protein
MAAIAREPNLNPFNNHINDPVESYPPQAYDEASSTQQPHFEAASTEEPLYGLDAGMEMEPEFENDFRKIHPCMAVYRTTNEVIVHLDLSNEFNFGGASNFDWPTANCLSPTTVTRQSFSFSFSAGSSPRPQSAGQRLSPFSRFINLEVIDTRPNFQLMANLPYFKLQSLLEQSGVITPPFPAWFPRLTLGFRKHLPADTSCAGRSLIVANEHFSDYSD